jgi:hypothetical protein
MQKASVGRIVHVLVDPSKNNGSDVAPAIVTRVWGEPYTPGTAALERQTVNIRVLCDSQNTLWLTSIWLFETRPTDEQLAALNSANPTGREAVAFWPPRV